MLDIKWIRENPKALADALVKRGAEADARKAIVDDADRQDEARRQHLVKLQDSAGAPQRRLEGNRQGDARTRTWRWPKS